MPKDSANISLANIIEAGDLKKTARRPLGRTLTLWFLLLAVAPMTIVSLISYHQAHDSLTEAAFDQLDQAAEAKIAFIQNWFNYRFLELGSWSESHDNTQLLMSLDAGLRQSGLERHEYIKSYDWALRVDASNTSLDDLARDYGHIHDLLLINNDGVVLYSVTRESDLGSNLLTGSLRNTRFANCVKKTLATGESRFSDLERYSPSGGIISGFMSAPMTDEFGNPVGILAVQINFRHMFEIISTGSSHSNTMKHYLVGEDGLARTPISGNHSEALMRKVDTKQFFAWNSEHARDDAVTEPAVHAEDTAIVYVGPSGQPVIGTHREVQLHGVSWGLISEVDEDEALVAADSLRVITIVLVVITALLATIIAIIQSRRITRPITELAKASIEVAEGAVDVQVHFRVNNEIGLLADAFNYMVMMRKCYEEELQKSNQQAQIAVADLVEQKYALDQHAIVAVTNLKGDITYCNDNFVKISGFSQDELLGHNHRIINSGYHDKEFFRNMYQTISAGEVWKGEICNRAKNGDTYWVDTTIVPFKGNNNKPVSYVAIRADITERKKMDLESQQRTQEQQVLIKLLEVGMRGETLQEKLASAFRIILHTPFLKLSDKGSIYLVSLATQELRLVEGNDSCLKSSQSKEIHFFEGSDPRNASSPDKENLYGRYDVPIIWNSDVVGVLELYLSESYRPDDNEFAFFSMMASILANIITQTQSQDALRKQKESLVTLTKDLSESKVEQETANSALRDTVHELERFNELAVGRELRMIDLKSEVNELLHGSGLDAKYTIVRERIEETAGAVSFVAQDTKGSARV
ncbi:PAS domain S-box protein [bacterium AH-315-F03]|nr:PAS domain S-box protein [bacterium AH-315-F03]